MSLQLSVTTLSGITAKNAIHRVEGLSIVNKQKISFQLRSYVDVTMPHFQDFNFECAYDIEGQNPLAQAYEYLKTLPEFKGSLNHGQPTAF